MEFFDILDNSGNKTGEIKLREQVHSDGDWHKTVRIWIINDNKELLLQKRSTNKDSNPDMWDISCAGHLEAGDSRLDGAVRELTGELGICLDAEQFEYLFSVKKNSKRANMYINNEFNDIYLIKLNLDLNEVKLQKTEVSEVKFVHYRRLEEMVKEQVEGLVIHKEEYDKLFEILENRLEN